MTEREIREAEEQQQAYKTAWVEAEYIVAGWWIEKPELSKDGQPSVC